MSVNIGPQRLSQFERHGGQGSRTSSARGKPGPCEKQNPALLRKTGLLRQVSNWRIFGSAFAWKRSHLGLKNQRDEGTMVKCTVIMRRRGLPPWTSMSL